MMPPTMVACSPPTTALPRSAALPIGSRGPGGATAASRLVARVSSDGGASFSEGAASSLGRPPAAGRFSFSSTFTPRSQSIAAIANAGAGRPPTGAVAAVKAPSTILVGFDAPPALPPPPAGAAAAASVSTAAAAAAAAAAAEGPLSPGGGRRETQPSLLSMALSDLPGAGSMTFGSSLERAGSGLERAGSGQLGINQEVDMSPLNALVPQHPVMDAPVVRAAYAAAARAHAGQFRKSGAPVLAHCLATAVILAELGLAEDAVAAGLLHDVLSDARMTAWQLEGHVPRGVVDLVEKVTRLSELSQLYRDNAHSLETVAVLDMLTSMSDVTALLVKLADRLDTMRTVGALARSKQVRMASETLEVFAVLANRLGAWSVKAELEDLSFKTLQPEDYEAVASAVAARAAAADLPARVAEVRAALSAAGLEAVDVSGRTKNVYGVWRKLQAAGLPLDRLGEVYDVAALRVVVPHKHDCYVALRHVEGLWAPLPGRFKDYIRNRKGNGYQSLHTTVTPSHPAGASPVEVQIRTPKMHYIAEYGFAAHWKYKERLSREDVWLDRLVQWKKWVATEKLRLRDAKVRAAGSPQRDPAIAALAAAAAASSASASASFDDGGAVGAAAAPAGSPGAAAADLDARFMARFSIAPVSESDAAAHGASIVISGPHGARLHAAPPGATLAQLLAPGTGAATEAEARRCSVRLNGRAVPLLARREVLLKAGDHVEFVEEPGLAAAPPAPQLPRRSAGGGEPAALDVFLPGRAAPVEVALRRPGGGAEAREAALVN